MSRRQYELLKRSLQKGPLRSGRRTPPKGSRSPRRRSMQRVVRPVSLALGRSLALGKVPLAAATRIAQHRANSAGDWLRHVGLYAYNTGLLRLGIQVAHDLLCEYADAAWHRMPIGRSRALQDLGSRYDGAAPTTAPEVFERIRQLLGRRQSAARGCLAAALEVLITLLCQTSRPQWGTYWGTTSRFRILWLWWEEMQRRAAFRDMGNSPQDWHLIEYDVPEIYAIELTRTVQESVAEAAEARRRRSA